MTTPCPQPTRCDWHPYTDEPLIETCDTSGCGAERPVAAARAMLAGAEERRLEPAAVDSREAIEARVAGFSAVTGGAA